MTCTLPIITEHFFHQTTYTHATSYTADAVSSVISEKRWVSITRIWNRVMNFGSGSGYSVPATAYKSL